MNRGAKGKIPTIDLVVLCFGERNHCRWYIKYMEYIMFFHHLNVHDVYIIMNRGVELKAKSPPSI